MPTPPADPPIPLTPPDTSPAEHWAPEFPTTPDTPTSRDARRKSGQWPPFVDTPPDELPDTLPPPPPAGDLPAGSLPPVAPAPPLPRP